MVLLPFTRSATWKLGMEFLQSHIQIWCKIAKRCSLCARKVPLLAFQVRVASCGATYPQSASHVIPVKFRRGGWNEKNARWAGWSVSDHGDEEPCKGPPSFTVREQQLRGDIDRFTHHHHHHTTALPPPTTHTHTYGKKRQRKENPTGTPVRPASTSSGGNTVPV